MTAKGKVEATTSFVIEVAGEQRIVHQGEVLPASDPAVKAHEELFEAK